MQFAWGFNWGLLFVLTMDIQYAIQCTWNQPVASITFSLFQTFAWDGRFVSDSSFLRPELLVSVGLCNFFSKLQPMLFINYELYMSRWIKERALFLPVCVITSVYCQIKKSQYYQQRSSSVSHKKQDTFTLHQIILW